MKKLRLKKQVISALNENEKMSIIGGTTDTNVTNVGGCQTLNIGCSGGHENTWNCTDLTKIPSQCNTLAYCE